MWLLILFTVVPLVEISLLVRLADRITWPWTFLLVLATGVIGAWLARREGVKAWRRVHENLGQGQEPTDAMLDGLMILIAGALLVTPGVLTDIVGFMLLIPPCRAVVKRRMRAAFHARVTTFQQHHDDGFIDVEAVVHDAEESTSFEQHERLTSGRSTDTGDRS